MSSSAELHPSIEDGLLSRTHSDDLTPLSDLLLVINGGRNCIHSPFVSSLCSQPSRSDSSKSIDAFVRRKSTSQVYRRQSLVPVAKNEGMQSLDPRHGKSLHQLTQVVLMKRTTGTDVSKAFKLHFLFKYGAPRDVLSANGPQFASELYQNTCRIRGVSNKFRSANH